LTPIGCLPPGFAAEQRVGFISGTEWKPALRVSDQCAPHFAVRDVTGAATGGVPSPDFNAAPSIFYYCRKRRSSPVSLHVQNAPVPRGSMRGRAATIGAIDRKRALLTDPIVSILSSVKLFNIDSIHLYETPREMESNEDGVFYRKWA
jgi:hypothetical protein